MQQLFYSKVKDLNEVIGNKENECDNLLENEELMQAKSEKAIIPTFHSGKFTDSVRQCCIELLSLNVGVRNVEPIIRSVLSNFMGVDIDRLPNSPVIIWFDLKQIATQMLSTVSGTEKCAL